MAVIHQYLREMMAGCGRMILASDSHTRYGALGTMGIGEGGPELVKQLLAKPYELPRPEVVAVILTGRPVPGVGPQDVSLALIRAVFPKGFVKNKVLEFIGPGVANSADGLPQRDRRDDHRDRPASPRSGEPMPRWRRGTKTTGVPRITASWNPGELCWYDRIVEMDLGRVEPMIALPFHPSNAWPIAEFNRNAPEILREVEEAGNKLIENPRPEAPPDGEARPRAVSGWTRGSWAVRRRDVRQPRGDGGAS